MVFNNSTYPFFCASKKSLLTQSFVSPTQALSHIKEESQTSLITPVKRRNTLQEAEATKMTRTVQFVPLLVAATSVSFFTAAGASNSTLSHPGHLQNLLAEVSIWREHHLAEPSSHRRGGTVLAWVLSFLAASVSSAGGVGGGSLFLPILNLVAGLSLKHATAFSSFMVTGAAASNVLYNLLCTAGGRHVALIDYDIALQFQPCLLLGVSIGVVCNVMFPEWLITVLFSLFLAFCTVKTCRAGVKIWRSEGVGAAHDHSKEPLLPGGGGGDVDAENGGHAGSDDRGSGAGFPWKDVALLVMAWLCFFALHVFIGDKHGKRSVSVSCLQQSTALCHAFSVSSNPLRSGLALLLHDHRSPLMFRSARCPPSLLSS
ncbi:sulfite exporter TauE/SafE family protein 5-like isoform X3 [Phragmites australis]|uniref:sulfite exporter TauE/SafE family protein 5-like isoform X3 n=1 Tax=Phragmites australis TaxID=29695 RepID=UPI002D78D20A|nr:sulfite exporter TauE/SafE family protein 5-like isoform X3 [Phragmites australis]